MLRVDCFYSTKIQGKPLLPFYETAVSAGLPVYANELGGNDIDLYEFLIKDSTTTRVLRVRGDSMDTDIQDKDVLIVDTSLEPQNGDIVIARMRDDEFVVKRFRCYSNRLWPVPDNPKYEPHELKEEDGCTVWGIVTKVIHNLR